MEKGLVTGESRVTSFTKQHRRKSISDRIFKQSKCCDAAEMVLAANFAWNGIAHADLALSDFLPAYVD